jgi:integrase
MPKRRGPHIYQRPGRLGWYAYLTRDRFHISLGTNDEAEARVAFGQLLQRERHLELAPGEVSLASLVVTLRERAETANTVKTAYELHLNLRRVVAWLEGRGITTPRKVTKDAVEDYKTERRFKVSAARINRELDSLRRLLRFAIERKHAPPWALDAIVKLREPRPDTKVRTATKAELARFLKHAPAAYRPLFRGAIGSGLRDGELQHLEPADIADAEVTVTPKADWSTKGYRHRTVPITAATAKALRAWVAARDAKRVNADQKKIWKVMQAASAAAKIEPISLHDLRRAWATHLYASGLLPLKDVSALLGHAKVETTERYLRLSGKVKINRRKLPW